MFEAEMHLGPYTQSKILLADTKKHDEEFWLGVKNSHR
jgi:hypothetical protein